MEVSVLSSGSSGNCFYVGSKERGILVDAGISSKRICKRLESLEINPKKVQGIFLTHEHSDHTRGTDVFARKFKIPIFATEKLLKNFSVCSNENLLNCFDKDSEFNFFDFNIKSFSKSHKAIEPVSFLISNSGKSVSVITDLGKVNVEVISAIRNSDFLCIESNHELEMLENGSYPYFLKKWISGEDGHLSNFDSASCVFENFSEKLKRVVLSHLSEKNNSPETALLTWARVFSKKKSPEIFVSTKEKATELFDI